MAKASITQKREGAEMEVSESTARTIYRYGPIAWFWRLLIVGGQGFGWFMVFIGFTSAELAAYLVAAPLILPGWFFGHVVATQVDVLDYGELVVTTLLGRRRRLTREDLGKPRFYLWAQATVGMVQSPRAWIPVRGRWPIYLDLLGHVPDRAAFIATFRLDKRHVPNR